MSVPFTFGEPYEFGGDDLVEVNDGSKTWSFAADMQKEIPKVYNMELREDDVWLLGFPKCGNTWATEMIYTVFHGGTKEANEKSHFDRWCWPEMSAYEGTGLRKLPKERAELVKRRDYFSEAVTRESPRFVRTHLPFSLLPPKLLDTCKVVYICRNVKDVLISSFKMIEDTGVIEVPNVAAMLEYMMCEKGMFKPVCQFVKEAWEKRHHPNMFFLYYEDMKRDLPGVMHKIAAFLGKSLTEEQVKELQHHLSVEAMRKNRNINMEEFKEIGILGEKANFVRKGISGDWKNHFTPPMMEKYDAWLKEQMGDTDFKFKEYFSN